MVFNHYIHWVAGRISQIILIVVFSNNDTARSADPDEMPRFAAYRQMVKDKECCNTFCVFLFVCCYFYVHYKVTYVQHLTGLFRAARRHVYLY